MQPLDLDAERPALTGLAYRMLGSVADAEDAVQDAYVRWLRLTEAERAAIAAPGAWMTRVVSRICLDMLGSARARRERYVGEWLPEPVPAGAALATASVDPLDRVTLDDSVSMALMVVLESLTPAERVAFVLHDVFGMPFAEIAELVGRSADATRRLASSARRRVRERRGASRERHDELARAFAQACLTGDVAALAAVLDPAVTLVSDGGGKLAAARRPVAGLDDAVRFLLGILRTNPDTLVRPVATGDGIGFVATRAGEVDTVAVLGVAETPAGARITDVWLVRNPDKLTLWG